MTVVCQDPTEMFSNSTKFQNNDESPYSTVALHYDEHGVSLVHIGDELTVLYVDHEPFPFPGMTSVFFQQKIFIITAKNNNTRKLAQSLNYLYVQYIALS